LFFCPSFDSNGMNTFLFLHFDKKKLTSFFCFHVLHVHYLKLVFHLVLACFAPGRVQTTPQRIELHLDLYGKEE
jgi:hypothetical protein